MSGIILSIDGHRYEVSRFYHPGEGIRGIELYNFKNKEVSEEFDIYHMTDEPWEMLERARENGNYEGIVYLGEDN